MTFKHILAAVDFSESSDRALAIAIDLAGQAKAKLTLLHVGPDGVVMYPDMGMGSPAGPAYQEITEKVHAAEKAQLARLSSEVVPHDVAHDTVMRVGVASDQILEQIQTGGHDLVVLGTHGRKGIERMLLGSVAEAVLRRSPVPVLVTH